MNDLIAMDNSIVTSAYNLTLNEQRLIYCALKQIPKGVPVEPETQFYISRSDFVELGANPDNVAKEIRQATKDLMKKTIHILTPLGVKEFHWLSEVLRYDRNAEKKLREKYKNKEDYQKYINSLRMYNFLDANTPVSKVSDDTIARVIFHPKVLPLLSDLKASFTQFLLSDVAEFGSIYSYRIYQLFMRYLNKKTGKGWVQISFDELRYMLVLIDKYPLTADLKRWVLAPAVKEINEKSPLDARYELVKTGRKFVAVKFFFELKEKPESSQKPSIDIYRNFKMTPKQLVLFAAKIENKTGSDIEVIVDELCNIHLQSKHIENLKSFNFTPSSWYNDEEVQKHPTLEQLKQAKNQSAKLAEEEKNKRQQELKKEFEIILQNAEQFVLNNIKRINTSRIEGRYLNEGNYKQIIKIWESDLMNDERRGNFQGLDKIK
ncbi:replication initiation protein [Moraxella catarrhalis]|uniref:replication initiation protein n=1 Tax=Moraxella catarrhalis TaxID=480 RepID=UPI0013D77FB3|nr:replication initiation protein [Moraxella catarrhalis]